MAESAADGLIAHYVQLLKDDAAIGGFVQDRIFNFVPRQTQYPYITVHITDSGEWDTSTDNGEEHSVYIHAWDDRESAKRVNQIMQRAFELVHDVTDTVNITDHNVVNVRRVNKQVEREGQLYHGIELFRAVTEEI